MQSEAERLLFEKLSARISTQGKIRRDSSELPFQLINQQVANGSTISSSISTPSSSSQPIHSTDYPAVMKQIASFRQEILGIICPMAERISELAGKVEEMQDSISNIESATTKKHTHKSVCFSAFGRLPQEFKYPSEFLDDDELKASFLEKYNEERTLNGDNGPKATDMIFREDQFLKMLAGYTTKVRFKLNTAVWKRLNDNRQIKNSSYYKFFDNKNVAKSDRHPNLAKWRALLEQQFPPQPASATNLELTPPLYQRIRSHIIFDDNEQPWTLASKRLITSTDLVYVGAILRLIVEGYHLGPNFNITKVLYFNELSLRDYDVEMVIQSLLSDCPRPTHHAMASGDAESQSDEDDQYPVEDSTTNADKNTSDTPSKSRTSPRTSSGTATPTTPSRASKRNASQATASDTAHATDTPSQKTKRKRKS